MLICVLVGVTAVPLRCVADDASDRLSGMSFQRMSAFQSAQL